MLKHATIALTASALVLVMSACQHTAPAASTTAQTNEPTKVTNTSATLPSDPLANVENRANVKTYPDETTFTPPRPAQLITGFGSEVRESPMGDTLATVETTEQVNEVARDKKGDYYLILYPDPANPSKKLAGWVYKDALENTSWAASGTSGAAATTPATTKLDCAKASPGQAHMRTDHDFCAKPCTSDSACDTKAGQRCDGHAFDVNDKTNKVTSAKYCVSAST
jgi:glucose/arabinose dehydrogenase